MPVISFSSLLWYFQEIESFPVSQIYLQHIFNDKRSILKLNFHFFSLSKLSAKCINVMLDSSMLHTYDHNKISPYDSNYFKGII